jgi:hypothetical protein
MRGPKRARRHRWIVRARDNFTPEGWKDFMRPMEGFLDRKGTPIFTSSFVATRDATVVDEKECVLHLRIP